MECGRGRPGAAGLLSVLGAAAVLWSGCAAEEGEVVARVADKAITAEDVRGLVSRQPGETGEEGPADPMEHLQTLVDMELLLLEAEKEGVRESPFFVRRTAHVRRDRLVGALEARRLDVTVSDDEVARYIEREGYDRAIRTADIMLPDRAAAARVLRLIEEGADFGDLARTWSANRETAPRGGEIDRPATRYQMIPVLARELFPLPVGSISRPVRVGQWYSIFKILEESHFDPTPQQKQLVAGELRRSKMQAARDSLAAALAQEYRLERDPEGLDRFVEALGRGAGSAPSTLELVLYRYDGGEIRAADVAEAARSVRGDILGGVGDSDELAAIVRKWVVPGVMLMEAALREGIDREEETARWLAEMERQTLITGLRGQVLQRRTSVTDDDARRFFEANRDRFLHPEQIEVEEILVATESEAAGLRRRIEAGADFGALARERSQRSPEIRGDKGRFHVHRHESPQFGGLVEAVVEAEDGALTGPVEVEEGWSVFRVLSRERRRETWEEARARATSQFRRQEHRQAFNEYVQELRERYAPQIEIRSEALEAAFAAAG